MKIKTCTWTVDDELSDQIYNTSCGHAWEFMNAGIKENEVKFCPYCGGRIEEA